MASTKHVLILPPTLKHLPIPQYENKRAIFSVRCASPVPRMCLAFLLVIFPHIKERRKLSLESKISLVFLLFRTVIHNCYTCVRICNLHSVVPKPKVKSLVTRMHLYPAIQGAYTIITVLIKRPENNL